MLIVFAGLPGTGKSTLARAIGSRLGGKILDKDIVRHAMFGPDRITFTTEQDDEVMVSMLVEVRAFLAAEPRQTVILDGRVFSKNEQLRRVIDFANSVLADWMVLECVCSPSTAKRRLAEDFGKHIAANRTPELYEHVCSRFEVISQPKTVIDTDLPLAECVEQAFQAITSRRKVRTNPL